MRTLKWLGLIAGLLAFTAVVLVYRFALSPRPRLPELSAEIAEKTFHDGTHQRTARIYVPKKLPRGSGLVIAFHGSTGDGEAMRRQNGYELDVYADEREFIVLYPDGYKGNWNDCRKASSFPARLEHFDDVAFTRVMIETMVAEHAIDPRHVYGVGYSNGGQMVIRLLLEAPGLLAGAAVAGTNLPVPENNACPMTAPTAPVLLVNGTADPIVPFAGGEATLFGFASRGFVLSSAETARALANLNDLSDSQESPISTDVNARTWTRDGTPWIEQWTVREGGHTIPRIAIASRACWARPPPPSIFRGGRSSGSSTRPSEPAHPRHVIAIGEPCAQRLAHRLDHAGPVGFGDVIEHHLPRRESMPAFDATVRSGQRE